MSFPTLRKVFATIAKADNLPELFNRHQDQVQEFNTTINKKPQIDSLTLHSINLTDGYNQVPHTLGKVLTGWTVIDQNAPATIHRYQPSDSTTLFLFSDIVVTISLQVY